MKSPNFLTNSISVVRDLPGDLVRGFRSKMRTNGAVLVEATSLVLLLGGCHRANPGFGGSEDSSGGIVTVSDSNGSDESSGSADETADDSSGGDPIECGNGVIEGGEECDGVVPEGSDCSTEAGTNPYGILGCNENCEFDTSNCSAEGCGDGVIDMGEQCDGDMVPQTCLDLGYGPGTLLCSPICTYDLSQCPDPVCGDGVINDGGEQCDGRDFDDATCLTLTGLSGELACNQELCDFDISGCTCGNGVVDGSDECDGIDLGGNDCTTIGKDFVRGDLGCNNDCTFNTDACTAG